MTTSACSKAGSTCSLQVNGKTRTYYLQLPNGYTSSKPYPVVFQFHWLGGTAEQALTAYRISSGMPDAIYITPQGLVGASPTSDAGSPGWANTNDEDIQFTKALVARVETDYCVDEARIFSVGFSYGGMMSYAIGLELGSAFRAIAPMSGALYDDYRANNNPHPIAMWGAHGTQDTFVPTADGRAARDQILAENHCGTQTAPVNPSPCVAYQGCDNGYPVTWCEWNGGHAMPNFDFSSAIAAFFKQF
jgi:polyhydroxybutyrate depolymerase